MKLTASAISAYLESPKSFYWRYVHRQPGAAFAGVEPSQPSQAAFDHDLLIGTCWAEFVDAFYKAKDKTSLDSLTNALTGPHQKFLDKSQGWLSEKVRQQYSAAFIGCMNSYFAQFSPGDGARYQGEVDMAHVVNQVGGADGYGSELVLENDRFRGTLDGLSHDGIIHECKMTSRAPSTEIQLWRIENSIQIKLYAVLAKAKGVRVEFAYKDAPNVVWRAPVREITDGTREMWQTELESLGDSILDVVDQAQFSESVNGPMAHRYFPCHPNGCTLVTKRFVGQCPYKLLCDGDPAAPHFYKERDNER